MNGKILKPFISYSQIESKPTVREELQQQIREQKKRKIRSCVQYILFSFVWKYVKKIEFNTSDSFYVISERYDQNIKI